MTKVRVAYLTGEFPRATDTWIQRELSALRNNNVDVDVYSIRRPGEEHLVGSEQQVQQDQTTYLLEQAWSLKLVTSHMGLFVRSPRRYLRSAALAWQTKRPGIKGSIYQLAYFIEAGLLAAKLKEKNITHIHNHFGDSSCSVAMLTSELADINFSFTLHGPGIFFEPHTWRLDEKLKRASFCACISYFCRSQAAIFSDPDSHDRLHIIHCGVNPDRLPQVEHSGPGRNLLFVARLAELKGVSVLLEAVQEVRQIHADVHLTIVGDGPERERFQRLAKKLGIDNHITFTGYLSQTEVTEKLATTDVLVLPSFAEGVPVTLMEALGSQVPVIATQVGGVSELVEDGVNGYIIRPGDSSQLAARIASLLADGNLRQTMGGAGKKKVRAEFDNDIEARRLRTLFENAQANLPSPVRPS